MFLAGAQVTRDRTEEPVAIDRQLEWRAVFVFTGETGDGSQLGLQADTLEF